MIGWKRTIHTMATAALLASAMPSYAQEEPADPAAAKKDPPGWVKSASLGFTLTDGNSDTVLFTAKAEASRKWDENEFASGAGVTYGEDDGEKNNEAVYAFGQYNRLFSDRFYGLVRLAFLHDAIADVEYRISLSPGLGYYFIKEENTTFSGEAGPSFIYEKQGSEETGYFAARLAERFDHKFSDRARVWQFAEFLPQVDDLDNWILNAEVGGEAALTEKVKLQIYIQDSYDNEPAPGRTENDLKVVSALAMTF